jgi:effector-binding domain-containing protein
MLDTPYITQSAEEATAIVRITVPRSEIRKVMQPGLAELMSTIAAQGIAPTGPWFSHHLKIDPEIFDFEISVPVTTPIKPSGRVQASVMPSVRVARAVYRGPYEHLGDGWEQLMSWIESNEHIPAEDRWERYVIGPDSTADAAAWETELNCPLIDPA